MKRGMILNGCHRVYVGKEIFSDIMILKEEQ